MIMPTLNNVHKGIEQATATYEAIKSLLHGKHYSTAIGDEGGFAPQFDQEGINREYAALTMLQLAVKKADLNPAIIRFGLDAAASHFYDTATKTYNLHGQPYTAEQLITWYDELCKTYPIMSIEDGLDEEDWDGWQRMTKRFGKKLMLVGDDIFVTNVERIKRGITNHVANATLIKPNQIGTVTETLAAIKCSQQAGYTVVISHRSGETDDTFIADLAVGTAAQWLKAGAPVRGERVAKYNRLMEIEERLK
jgi:enolase